MKNSFEIIDCHIDLVHGLQQNPRKFSEKTDIGHIDVPRLKEGNVSGAFFAVFPTTNYYYLRHGLDFWFKTVEDKENKLLHVKKFEDLGRAKNEGKIGAILHFEGAGGIDSSFAGLRNAYRLGLRSMGITWSDTNIFATGVYTDKDCGLSEKGKELIKEMEKLGIIVDVSHLNRKSFWDIVEIVSKPFIASHSNARAICDNERNLDDEQLEAIKDNEGVVGINLCNNFLQEGNPKPEDITLEQIKKHIDHIVEKVGINHIALGSDYDGATVPTILKDVSYYPKLLSYLNNGGYNNKEIEKITRQNIVRVIKKVWK